MAKLEEIYSGLPEEVELSQADLKVAEEAALAEDESEESDPAEAEVGKPEESEPAEVVAADSEKPAGEPEKSGSGDDILAKLVGAEVPKGAEESREAEAEEAGEGLADAALKATAESDPAIAGLIKDLQAERTKRQDAEAKIKETQERLRAIEERQEAAAKVPNSNAEILQAIRDRDGLSDDDALNVAQMTEYEQQKDALTQHQRQVSEDQARAEFKQRSDGYEHEMRRDYGPERVGPNRDYDSVTQLGRSLLQPEDHNAILAAANPPREFYIRSLRRLAGLSPSHRQFYLPTTQAGGKKQNPPARNKEPKPGTIPRGGGQMSNARAVAETQEAVFDDLIGKTDDELDAMLERTP
jgi:hypothetical protein